LICCRSIAVSSSGADNVKTSAATATPTARTIQVHKDRKNFNGKILLSPGTTKVLSFYKIFQIRSKKKPRFTRFIGTE
jgi:hypothetical protein